MGERAPVSPRQSPGGPGAGHGCGTWPGLVRGQCAGEQRLAAACWSQRPSLSGEDFARGRDKPWLLDPKYKGLGWVLEVEEELVKNTGRGTQRGSTESILSSHRPW